MSADRTKNVSRRRDAVLKLLFQGLKATQIAQTTGASYTSVKNDEYRLRLQGRYPVPPSGDRSPEATERLNHVARVYEYPSVHSASDFRNFLPGITASQARSDVRWLVEHGYAKSKEKYRDEDVNVQAAQAARNARHTDAAEILREEQAETALPAPPPPEAIDFAKEARNQMRRDGTSRVMFKTTATSRHSHHAVVDAAGCGLTLIDESEHVHQVYHFRVLTNDGHLHELALA